jgi:predicted Zn-dependent protease
MKQSVIITICFSLLLSMPVSAYDWEDLKKDWHEISNTIKRTAKAVDDIPDEVKDAAVSSSKNLLKEDSLKEEVLIGQTISGRLLGASNLVKDDDLQRYVNNVGSWVASQSERTYLKWHFGVIDSDDINAFAAPGGYVFLTKGLYQTLNSEAELAAVLAHEISHVLQKHHLKLLKHSSWIELGRVAAEYQLGEYKLGEFNKYIDSLLGNGAEIMARGLDKYAELEADEMGVVLIARSGYNAYALPIVLQQIGHASEISPYDVRLLFKTHPHPNTRLDNLLSSMDGFSDDGLMLERRFYRF